MLVERFIKQGDGIAFRTGRSHPEATVLLPEKSYLYKEIKKTKADKPSYLTLPITWTPGKQYTLVISTPSYKGSPRHAYFTGLWDVADGWRKLGSA